MTEVLGYFTFFWLFVFNAQFRRAQIADWREGSILERSGIIFEAALSFLFGVVVPAALIGAIAFS